MATEPAYTPDGNITGSCAEEEQKITSQPEPYRYQPLDSQSNEIRLLRIPPKNSNSSTPPEYTLFHTSLSGPHNFLALSYCWGDHTLSHTMDINNHSMPITESLAAALTSLQPPSHDVLLWADAICINQHDPIEKTAQVQLMRNIYQTAAQVIIWLGPSTPDTYYTMREMRKLGDELIELGLWDLSSEELLRWDEHGDGESAATKQAISTMRDEHLKMARRDEYPFWWIMSDLGKRAWFHRIWCIQECTNARIATFRCGADEVDFTQLWAVALYFRIFSSRSHPDVHGDAHAFWKDNWLANMLSDALPTTLIGIRRKYLVSGGHELRTLLDRVIVKDSNSRRIDATDPRDRVFALLGIANDDAAREIVADYTLSCEQAYIMTATALLRHGHDDVLSLCRQRGGCSNLPSWVPDWSAHLRKPWSVWHTTSRLYCACGPSSALLLPPTQEPFSPHLTLPGLFIDTLASLGHAFTPGLSDQIHWPSLAPYFADLSHFLAQSPLYTPSQKEEAEWRIPVGDTQVAETNSQMVRATPNSHMKAGHAVAKAMASDAGAADELVKENFLAFACYTCQMGRMYDSQVCVSERGWVGVCPVGSQEGDVIVVFAGARVPYIVRKADAGGGMYTLIGESYIHGIMDGEAMVHSPAMKEMILC